MLPTSVMVLDVIYIYIDSKDTRYDHDLEVFIILAIPLASDVIYICNDAGCYLHRQW